MVAITAAVAPPASIPSQPARSSPGLDAELRNYRAQLADWVTCPSAKTPQGKAHIAKISDKLEAVKARIKQSDGSSAAETAARKVATSDAARARVESGDALRPPRRPGALVDTYA